MDFLKCIFCNGGPVKIFAVSPSGNVKSKCFNCGINSANDSIKKDKIKTPEVIYK